MKWLVSAALALVVATGAVRAAGYQEEAPAAPADESVVAFEAVSDAFDKAREDFFTVYRAEKDEAARRKLVDESYPKPEAYMARFWTVVEAHPKSKGAVRSLNWIASNASGAEQARALSVVERDFLDSEDLGDLCMSLQRARDAASAGLLEKLWSQNPHRAVKGKAGYSLAQSLLSSSKMAVRLQAEGEDSEYRTNMVGYYGEDTIAKLLQADAQQLRGDAEKLLETVATDYGDLVLYRQKTLKAAAEGTLFELRNLSVGQVAPDIEAEDLEGVTFKLSDYRGKVVVLDFWGNW